MSTLCCSTPLGPAASKAALRQALAGVVRPQDLVWRSLGRFAHPASSLLPPGILGHDPGRRRPTLSREEGTLSAARSRDQRSDHAPGCGSSAISGPLQLPDSWLAGGVVGTRRRGQQSDADHG